MGQGSKVKKDKKTRKVKKKSSKKLKKATFGDVKPVRVDRPRPMRKIGLKSGIAAMTVQETEPLSPTVRRIVLAPVDPERRPESKQLVGEYVRVVVPPSGATQIPEPQWRETKHGAWPVWAKPAPPSRKYTIRQFWPESGAIEINVTLHDKGPGTDWARSVLPGETTYVLGPKSGYRVSYDYDFYLMVCDETGLPGVSRWLEQLPSTARGHVFVQAPSPGSFQQLSVPPGMTVTWLNREDNLSAAVMKLPRPEGEAFAWIAAESTAIRPLRRWMRETWELEKADGYSSGYWKDKTKR